MDRRIPSDLVKVLFTYLLFVLLSLVLILCYHYKVTPKGVGATLDVDDVYRQFRRYGQIHEISVPSPSKGTYITPYNTIYMNLQIKSRRTHQLHPGVLLPPRRSYRCTQLLTQSHVTDRYRDDG